MITIIIKNYHILYKFQNVCNTISSPYHKMTKISKKTSICAYSKESGIFGKARNREMTIKHKKKRKKWHSFNNVPSHVVSFANRVAHHQLWCSLQVDEARGLDSCNPCQEAACEYQSLAKHGHCGQDSGAGRQTQHLHCAL